MDSRNYLVHRYNHVDDAIAMDSISEVRAIFMNLLRL